MHVWKFNPNTDKPQPEITEQALVDMMRTGSRFTFGTQELLSHGVYKEAGYAFDIGNRLHCYVYRQYGDWHQVYAPDRTTLRRLIGGRIDEILESKKFKGGHVK